MPMQICHSVIAVELKGRIRKQQTVHEYFYGQAGLNEVADTLVARC